MKNIICIIGAREGSKGIIKKNIQLLGGYPLIAYSIIASNLLNQIKNTYVSTDSAEIAKIAESYGAEIIMRPKELAKDDSRDIEFMQHAIFELSHKKPNPDIIVYLRPTTPLREISTLNLAIDIFKHHEKASSLRSAELLTESPFKYVIPDKSDEYWEGFIDKLDNINKPRQSYSPVFKPNGYIDIINVDTIRSGDLYGDKILAFKTKRTTEIDTIDDLKIAEKQLYDNPNNDIFKHLFTYF